MTKILKGLSSTISTHSSFLTLFLKRLYNEGCFFDVFSGLEISNIFEVSVGAFSGEPIEGLKLNFGIVTDCTFESLYLFLQ